MARVLETPLDALAQVLQGNVVAQVQLVQRVLPGMLARGRGAIVNLVSASGAMDPPAPTGEGGWGFAYAASKAAFMRLTGVLAVEHRGSPVRFFDVEPGFVLTELMQQSALRAGFAEQWGGAPPEVPAAVIAWLLTDPGAEVWHGRMVSAQRLCKQLGLVPGWPARSRPG
jgi:NAD(P)-dependent dehydrogenase (short-subunit alcohol dehydrogenase family)